MDNALRRHIISLENSMLWDLFDENEIFEKSGTVAEEARLRLIAEEFINGTALDMFVVSYEVFRELALRGSSKTNS